MIQWLVIMAIIAIASVSGGAIISSYVHIPQTVVVDNATIYHNNTTPPNSLVNAPSNDTGNNEGNNVDVGKWLWHFPGIQMFQNMIEGIGIFSQWCAVPFSWVLCYLVGIFNPMASCPAWSGFIILIPLVGLAIWSFREKFEKTFMILVITIVVIFIIGIVLLFLNLL